MSWGEARLVVTEYRDDGGMTVQYRIPLDLGCLTISATGRDVSPTATVAHAQGCRCGDWQALTGPPKGPS